MERSVAGSRLFFSEYTQNHFRHAAFSTAKYFLPFKSCQEKSGSSSGHQKVAGTLSQLSKVDNGVFGSFGIGIDRCLSSHKADVCLARKYGCHGFICTKPGDKIQIYSFFGKIAFLYGNILRGIKMECATSFRVTLESVSPEGCFCSRQVRAVQKGSGKIREMISFS